MAGLERGVELTHAVPVLGDLLGVDGLIGAPDQRCKLTVVAVGIDPVDALVLDSSDARAEAQAQHGEGGEVDLGIRIRVKEKADQFHQVQVGTSAVLRWPGTQSSLGSAVAGSSPITSLPASLSRRSPPRLPRICPATLKRSQRPNCRPC